MTTLHHGSHCSTTTAHEGQCWTDDDSAAEHYAAGGTVTTVTVDLSALVVERCAGYSWDDNYAPADDAAFRAAAAARGVDVLRYSDADDRGQEHTCYRLVSDRAVAAFAPVAA